MKLIRQFVLPVLAVFIMTCLCVAAEPPVHAIDIEPTNETESVVEAEKSEYKTKYAGMTAAQIAVAKAAEAAEAAKESENVESDVSDTEVEGKSLPTENMGKYNWGFTSHKLSDEDRDLIERVVAAEARSQSYEGMVGVAQVIRERAECWGFTAREVVTAKNQFAAPFRGEVSDEIKAAVSAVFDDGARVFAENTTHFHATYVNPWWNKCKTYRGTIDAHLFWG